MTRREILAGLSLMPDEGFSRSTYPLFEEGIVDWVEWTIDSGWGDNPVVLPVWLDQILDFYGQADRLSGHGVQYSALTSRWSEEQESWLDRLGQEVAKRKYANISEHFGYARAGRYLFHAPMPVPFFDEALARGQENLSRLADTAGCPVGIENLALAFGKDDVDKQGQFLDALLEPVNGFIVLDLHNLYCQSLNFERPLLQLVQSYPLERVTEIHISGGSFSLSQQQHSKVPIRRDTHDGPVPEELFEILPSVLKLCENARVVVLERLGNTFTDQESERMFALEFKKLKATLAKFESQSGTACGSISAEKENHGIVRPMRAEHGKLEKLQSRFLDLLENEKRADELLRALQADPELKEYSSYFSTLEPRMLEVAQELLRKWGVKREH